MKFLLLVLLTATLAGCATVPPPQAMPITTMRPGGGMYHEVQSGETLWRISKMYNVDMDTIVKANSIEDATAITRGQRILIPGTYKKREESRPYSAADSFIWPVNGNVIAPYGVKIGRVKNKGIDISVAQGTGIRASRAGRVVFGDDGLKGFGKTVIIDHGDNYQTVYAYNSDILVRVGESVEQNRVIARAGKTGRAKEPSLHFEIRRNGEPKNPYYYLPR